MNPSTNCAALPPMAGSVSWPEEDEHDFYENETSHLRTLVDACDLEWKGWPNIAKKLNAAHGNNRSATACRKKWNRISSQNVKSAGAEPAE
jgi:hypothetical protein